MLPYFAYHSTYSVQPPNGPSPSACAAVTTTTTTLSDGRADLTVSSPNHKTSKNGGARGSSDQGYNRDQPFRFRRLGYSEPLQ